MKLEITKTKMSIEFVDDLEADIFWKLLGTAKDALQSFLNGLQAKDTEAEWRARVEEFENRMEQFSKVERELNRLNGSEVKS